MMACRTAVLGGPLAPGDRWRAHVLRSHSCHHRPWPTWQPLAQVRWVQARLRALWPIPYFHCVLTLPPALPPLAPGPPRVLSGLLWQTAAATLQPFGWAPPWRGGARGLTMGLHPWSPTLAHPIPVHCVVTGGA
jgi:hypothetical protein